MNLVELNNTKAIHKNQLNFCTPTMKHQQEKLREQFHPQRHQKEQNIQVQI